MHAGKQNAKAVAWGALHVLRFLQTARSFSSYFVRGQHSSLFRHLEGQEWCALSCVVDASWILSSPGSHEINLPCSCTVIRACSRLEDDMQIFSQETLYRNPQQEP